MALKAKRSPVGVKSSQYSPNSFASVHKAVSAMFSNPDPDRSFVVADGSRFGSIWELGTNLRIMNPDIYGHHVSEEKNDFAIWVGDVHNDKVLVERLLGAKNNEHAAKIVVNHVVQKLHAAAQEGR